MRPSNGVALDMAPHSFADHSLVLRLVCRPGSPRGADVRPAVV